MVGRSLLDLLLLETAALSCFLQSSTEHFGEVVRELKRRCNLQYVYCCERAGRGCGCRVQQTCTQGLSADCT